MNIVNYESKGIIMNYVIHVLVCVDKAIAVRQDLINNWKGKNVLALNLFKSRHGISDEELRDWVNKATQYILNIRVDALSRMDNMSLNDLMAIMNNESIKDKFIEKYRTREDELKNDSFFQCSEHLHRCIDSKG